MKKKGLVTIFGMVLAVALLMGAPVWAYDLSDHVTVAQNLQGDLLVFPVYAAGSGLQTKFTVINSSNTDSVVAKVILRSHKYSQEVLDFLIYLSPNDTFDARIYYLNGKYWLTSSDGSLVAGGIAASAEAPLAFELAAPCDGNVDNAGFGYIDVIEAWSVFLPKEADGTVLKSDIVEAYEGWDGSEPTTINTLSGYAEIDFVGADYAAFNATALQDYGNEGVIGVAVETLIGDSAHNTLCEVEGALAKTELVLPYYDAADAASLPILTFPTKLALCPAAWSAPDEPEANGPFFDDNGFDVTYTLTYYDKEEHKLTKTCSVSPCPESPELDLGEEVNFVAINSPFDAGWARASFSQTTYCYDGYGDYIYYDGAPVIPLVGHFTADGFTLVPAAYTPGEVGLEEDGIVG
jgi:hypothetical protein